MDRNISFIKEIFLILRCRFHLILKEFIFLKYFYVFILFMKNYLPFVLFQSEFLSLKVNSTTHYEILTRFMKFWTHLTEKFINFKKVLFLFYIKQRLRCQAYS